MVYNGKLFIFFPFLLMQIALKGIPESLLEKLEKNVSITYLCQVCGLQWGAFPKWPPHGVLLCGHELYIGYFKIHTLLMRD